MSNLKDLPYELRLKELKLPMLAHRRFRGDMIQTFKLVKRLDDCPLENFFTIAHYNKRGHSYKLEKPRCSLSSVYLRNKKGHGNFIKKKGTSSAPKGHFMRSLRDQKGHIYCLRSPPPFPPPPPPPTHTKEILIFCLYIVFAPLPIQHSFLCSLKWMSL